MAQTTLFTRAQIDQRVAEMGKQITEDFRGQEVIALCVLKWAVFFCTDLLRQIDLDVKLDFIQVSSYGNEKYSSGVVTVSAAADHRGPEPVSQGPYELVVHILQGLGIAGGVVGADDEERRTGFGARTLQV